MSNNATVINASADNNDPIPSTIVYDSYYALEGYINDKYAITMDIVDKAGEVKGQYRYNNQKEYIKLEGNLKDSTLYLTNTSNTNDLGFESFKGKFSDNKFSGVWELPNKIKSCEFNLNVVAEKAKPNLVIITDARFNYDMWNISKIKIFTNKGVLKQTIETNINTKENKLYLSNLDSLKIRANNFIEEKESPIWWVYNGSQFMPCSN